MDHSVPHDLDLPTAKRVAERAWESYSERFKKYDPKISWVRDHEAKISFSAKGLRVEGKLLLRERAIEMSLEVPFLLRPFKKIAIEVIEEEIRRWIAKAKAGEI